MEIVMSEMEYARYCACCDTMHPCVAIIHLMSQEDVGIIVECDRDSNVPAAEVVCD